MKVSVCSHLIMQVNLIFNLLIQITLFSLILLTISVIMKKHKIAYYLCTEKITPYKHLQKKGHMNMIALPLRGKVHYPKPKSIPAPYVLHCKHNLLYQSPLNH